MEKLEEVLVGVRTLTEAQSVLEAMSGVQRIEGDLYLYRGQVAWLTLPFSSTPLGDALRFMNKVGVYAAPKLLEVLNLPSGETIVVYEIPGAPEIYPSSFSGPAPLAKGAAERLRQDMELMFATGYVHPLAVSRYDNWRIVEGTGCVIFDGWEALRAMSPDEIADARAAAEALISACQL